MSSSSRAAELVTFRVGFAVQGAGLSAVHAAALATSRHRAATDILSRLLSGLPQLLAELREGNLALLFAAVGGECRAVQMLLECKALPTLQGPVPRPINKPLSPLQLSAYFGHDDALRSMLAAGAAVNEAMPDLPLPLLAPRHHGAKPADTASGWRMLHFCAYHAAPQSVQALLSAGADPRLRTPEPSSMTPLSVLCKSPHLARGTCVGIDDAMNVADVLLAAAPEPQIAGEALRYAPSFHETKDFVAKLLEKLVRNRTAFEMPLGDPEESRESLQAAVAMILVNFCCFAAVLVCLSVFC